jgi:hypothetical protein
VKKPIRRPRRRQADNINITFQVTGQDGEECIQMTQNRAYLIAQIGSKWLTTGTIIDDADCIQVTERTGPIDGVDGIKMS